TNYLYPGPSRFVFLKNKIAPLVEELHVSEGDNVTLSCNYNTSTNDALQWYRQFPRSRPEFLLYIYSHGTLSDPLPPRMSAEVKDKKLVDLIISSAAVSDSALYYCALKPTVTGNPVLTYTLNGRQTIIFLTLPIVYSGVTY
uniref:Ig-like domain-containing protein n=1 Tax=Pygocentrus nattereri TaxID=42514 RepID=A0A3B4E707_PYGNA